LAGLVPRLVEALAQTPEPDETLKNLERATATLGAKATFYELLTESPDALALFVQLAASSGFLVATLSRRPGVFDEVVDRLLTGFSLEREPIVSDMHAALRRAEDPTRALRDVRAIHLLLVGIRDVSGKANVQNTSHDLAVLAEAALQVVLDLALARVRARRSDQPVDAAGRPLPFFAFALGRLGGRELSYASDLDLLFLHEGSVPTDFFEEVAQEALRLANDSSSAETI
jgi:glutamate-ammonia-ligase adenylyltransferase